MKNLSYVFRRLLKMNYGAMVKKINSIHKKTGKSRLFLFRDMKDCAVKYGAGYMDYDLFEMYNLTDEQRDTYLTRGRNDALVKKYNDYAYRKYFSDKTAFKVKHVEFYVVRVAALKQIVGQNKLKPAFGYDFFNCFACLAVIISADKKLAFKLEHQHIGVRCNPFIKQRKGR